MRILPRWAVAALALACASAVPAGAQQLIASYYALLADVDLRNSRGVPLGDFCAVVQQDRANYHRFGLRHDMDRGDPIFASREARAQIASTCRLGPGSGHIPSMLAQYGSRFVYVEVFGSGGWPTLVVVHEGAG